MKSAPASNKVSPSSSLCVGGVEGNSVVCSSSASPAVCHVEDGVGEAGAVVAVNRVEGVMKLGNEGQKSVCSWGCFCHQEGRCDAGG